MIARLALKDSRQDIAYQGILLLNVAAANRALGMWVVRITLLFSCLCTRKMYRVNSEASSTASVRTANGSAQGSSELIS
jgi:hypothetical protein